MIKKQEINLWKVYTFTLLGFVILFEGALIIWQLKYLNLQDDYYNLKREYNFHDVLSYREYLVSTSEFPKICTVRCDNNLTFEMKWNADKHYDDLYIPFAPSIEGQNCEIVECINPSQKTGENKNGK